MKFNIGDIILGKDKLYYLIVNINHEHIFLSPLHSDKYGLKLTHSEVENNCSMVSKA